MLIKHMRLLEQVLNFGIHLLEFVPQGMGNVHFPGWLYCTGQSWPEHPLVQTGQKQTGVPALGRQFITGGAGLAADQTLEPEPTQIIRHLPRLVVGQIPAH